MLNAIPRLLIMKIGCYSVTDIRHVNGNVSLANAIREDGKPVHIEDKDRASFKTKSGRPVLDGGGVTPDVSMDGDRKSAAIYGLLSKNLIFNYATQYAADHP